MTIIYADEDTELTEDEFTSQEKILPLVRIMNKVFCFNGHCCKKVWWGPYSCKNCVACRHSFFPHANYDGTRAPSHNPLQYQGGTPSHKPQYQGGTPSHKPLQYQGGTPSHKPLQYQGYDGTPSHSPQYQGK